MKKLHIKLLFCIFAFIGNHIQLFAQIPVNDAGWILQPNLSDEFDSAYLNLTRWSYTDNWPANGAEINYVRNLIMTGTGVGNGTLKIKADTLIPNVAVYPSNNGYNPPDTVHYAYQGGHINTNDTIYKYGYIEISAKFPVGHYDAWPAFWLWSGNCTTFYNEIDIAENGGGDSRWGNTGTNMHVYYETHDSCSWDWPTTENYQRIYHTPPLDTSIFHKYAAQWEPNTVIYYIDDLPVRTIYKPDSTPTHNMGVILNFCIDPWNTILPTDWDPSKHHTYNYDTTGTDFPQYFEIDYMRYYKLNADCSTDKTICNPGADYSSRAVEKTITTGGSCSPTFNTSDGYTLRATDYVILDAGTTINADGSGQFSVIVTPCPQ